MTTSWVRLAEDYGVRVTSEGEGEVWGHYVTYVKSQIGKET